MKQLCFALSLVLFFSSCQKDLASKDEVNTAIVSSDANSPLKSHSITFTSDYPVKPGEVPPFSFTKTQYPDSRIRTIRMLSRKNPIHPAFKKEAVELIGTFTYSSNPGNIKKPNLAYLKGTSEVWEYYKNPNGTGAKKSVSKKNINYKFFLNPLGHCTNIIDMDLFANNGDESFSTVLGIDYTLENSIDVIAVFTPMGEGNALSELYYGQYDQYGNLTGFWFPYGTPSSYFRITYDYSAPRGNKNFSFIPSQNLVTQEFSLLEVMQWLPQSSYQRKTAGGTFKVNGQWVNQDQIYKNYQFDVNGNQKSLTYGDNILQKTTWHVQP